ncbi:MAG: phage Gp37/Gp68 family protein [Chloroflexota bacterium]
MGTTSIEWTATRNNDGTIVKGVVWNPTTGCTKVSAGCKNCYAERIAKRFWKDRKFTEVRCHPERLDIPLHWKKPRRIFVDSMSDLFHPDVPDEFIRDIWIVMHECKLHTFMILTKRPERMQWLLNRQFGPHLIESNVWLGVSCEDQKTADERIPLLVQTSAALRFVSIEPMLGKIDLSEYLDHCSYYCDHGDMYPEGHRPERPKIDWLICGCESGSGARPMNLDWARSLRDQCVSAGIPFFLKQAVIDGKLVKMPELDGRIWDQYPEKKSET